MKILKEGDRSAALAEGRGRVGIVYEYRDITLDSGVRVRNVLVGVDEETGEVLTIPAQSAPKIRSAREGLKDATFTVRLPSELDDLLWLVSDHFRVNPSKFTPALIRFYLDEATEKPGLARRLVRLAEGPLARQKLTQKVTLRTRSRLLEKVRTIAERNDSTQSDLVRGAVIAAKEDVIDGKAKRRADRLRSLAAAV